MIDQTSRLPKLVWNLLAIIVIGLVYWAARYWHSPAFGLYEDDWMIVPQAVDFSTSEMLHFVGDYIIQLRGHVRPLSDGMIYFFSHFGGSIAGIEGIYLIGFSIQFLNLILFYALLLKVSRSFGLEGRAFGLMGGLGYALFAADTSQVFLTHSLGLHPSLTLVLIAFHMYISRYKWLSYLPAGLILFSYETPFLLFLAVPLLQPGWNLRWKAKPSLIKEILRHGLIILMMLVGVFVLRSVVDDGRVEGLGWKGMLLTPILHILQGPWIAVGSYILRPFQALTPDAILPMVLAFGMLAILFWRLTSFQPWNWTQVRTAWLNRNWQNFPPELQSLLKLVLTAVVLIILAYPLTFTVRAYAISGRDTRVHAAAVIGVSLLWACLGSFIFAFAHKRGWKLVIRLGLAAWFALMVGYGFVIQTDYVRAWDQQRTFWNELLPLISDMDVREGMVVLIEPSGLSDTTQIDANTWILPRLLERIYAVPPEWNHPPRVYRLAPGWEDAIAAEDGQLRVNGATAIVAQTESFLVPSQNVIWIVTKDGHLTRIAGPLQVGDEIFPLYPGGNGELGGYPHGIWYDYLMDR